MPIDNPYRQPSNSSAAVAAAVGLPLIGLQSSSNSSINNSLLANKSKSVCNRYTFLRALLYLIGLAVVALLIIRKIDGKHQYLYVYIRSFVQLPPICNSNAEKT